MIPKQLFFIWFGDSIPDYCKYSIDSFKQVNPDFNVDLIYYTKDEIVNSQDSVVNYIKNLIFQTKNGINNKYYDYISLRIKSRFNFLQILSDVIRFEILYYYGGIYLDCDTFPVKRFDNNLLNCNGFAQNVTCYRNKKTNPKHLSDDLNEYYDLGFAKNPLNYHLYTYTDIYFVGLCKEYTDNEVVFTTSANNKNPLLPTWIRNLENTKIFNKYREKFKKCKLQLYKEHIFYSQYILHLCNKKWQCNYKDNPMYCEYDDYLYGDE